MSEHTNIEWTDRTFNPWVGCTKVSPGCAHCYAETLMDTRYGRVKWGAGQPRVRTSAANWKLPLRWNRAAGEDPFPRPRVFCASLADWLDDEVPVEWLADLLDLISRTPNLDWQLLSKRPENWRARLGQVAVIEIPNGDDAPARCAASAFAAAWLNGAEPANVWIGTTVEDQQRADERIPELRKIPSLVRFLSCEPMLGQVNLDLGGPKWWTAESYHDYIHWVICGGESGPGARPMLVEWADDLLRQCELAGVAFFMKQLGAHVGTKNANARYWPESVTLIRNGTVPDAAACVRFRDRKGGDFAEFPSELQVREFPV